MSTDSEIPINTETTADSGGVWPPPPTDPAYMAAAMQQGSRSAVSYHPARTLMRCLIGLLTLIIIADVLRIALLLIHNASIYPLERDVYLTYRTLWYIAYVCFLRWTYLTYKNLRAFGVAGLKNSPGWAVGYFFVPVLSLYRPYVVFQEIWQASNLAYDQSQDRAWKESKESLFIGFWWGAWIFSDIIPSIAMLASLNDPASPDTLWTNLAGVFLSALSSALSIALIRMLSKRQAAKYARVIGEA